jgi:hypothetical protein
MGDFALESSAFDHARPIRRRYTCDGEDVSPPLRWTNVPDEARSRALLVDDTDAPSGVFTHWVAWGIDPSGRELDEGEAATGEGRNDFGSVGYRGPCPPRGHGPHRYFFRLYALDRELELDAGAAKADLLRAIEGHLVTTAELVGIYER